MLLFKSIKMEHRLQKIIANAGVCSRRKAEDLIEQGKVKVNGKVISLGDKADPDKDKITIWGKPLLQTKKIYLAFNKPPDCLTTLDDPRGRKTIFDYISKKERIIPVGRLDFKTEGLLLLTNDGDFANNVMHPRYEVNKTYVVHLDKPFTREAVEKLKKGIDVEDKRTSPAKVRFANEKKDIIEVTIHEGRNRIVRKMMQELEYKVQRLIRVKIGNVALGTLPKGHTRNLSFQEVKSLMPKNKETK